MSLGRRHRGRHFGSRGLGGGFGPARRAGRGDIRAAILALLAEEPMHGYQIIRELSERSGGVWRPSPGSVYPTLAQLEDEGLIQPEQSSTGKRVFSLTDEGRTEAASLPSAPWDEVAETMDDDLVALRDLAAGVIGATRTLAHAGSRTQLEAAKTILRDARRSLYRLLSEDDEPTDGPTTTA